MLRHVARWFGAIFASRVAFRCVLFGAVLLGASVFMREPTIDQLVPIQGRVLSTTAITRGGQVRRYEFTMEGHPETFWSYHEPVGVDASNPTVTTFAELSGGSLRRRISGTVKTYGLVRDGFTIHRPEEDLQEAHMWLDYVLPVLGSILLIVGLAVTNNHLRSSLPA
jgi:hypothetical protein